MTCQAQNEAKNPSQMEDKKSGNPLLCDIETGMCETGENETSNSLEQAKSENKSIKIVYFTDPICSSCWGIEPQLRKLKLEYGAHINIEYRMGGLLPDWSYNSGGISQPSDVAHHWDEVSEHYDMPIDGDVWLEDPLDSSYPPSIAYKAAQLQSNQLAVNFMRKIREMVFLEKINIAKYENLEQAAQSVGLDAEQFQADFNGQAKALFEADLKLAQDYGVRGFPTLFFMNSAGKQEKVYGTKPYAFFEMGILKLDPNIVKSEYSKDWESLFAHYPSLTAKEFAELSGVPRNDSEKVLNNLSDQELLVKTTTKNGSLWTIK